MVEKATLKTVDVLVNGQRKEIKVEQGVTFENKKSIYTLDENSKLKRRGKTANVWEEASEIKMRNYQWKAFLNIANNDGDATTYTKADIEKAMELYGNGGFKTDMSKDLPSGYSIGDVNRFPKYNKIQAYVTNGNSDESATLKFSFSNKPQVLNQNAEKVINYEDLDNHPTKYFGISNGKLDECFGDRLPYVENGKVTLKCGDYSTVTCTYKDGKLVDYRRDVHGETVIPDGQITPPHSNKGDHQYVEFYPNGQVKSVDIRYLEYGEFDGIQMKCQYDENGNYLSGTKRVYDPYSHTVDWVEMNAEYAAGSIDIYLNDLMN